MEAWRHYYSLQGQSTGSSNFLLRQPAGEQISISFHVHVLVLVLLLTFPHQCMFDFLPDALQGGGVKLFFRVRQ